MRLRRLLVFVAALLSANAALAQSSFRGIELGQTREEMEAALSAEAVIEIFFTDRIVSFPSDPGRAPGLIESATVNFDDDGKISRILAYPGFFGLKDLTLPEFAQAVADAYNVELDYAETTDGPALVGQTAHSERLMITQPQRVEPAFSHIRMEIRKAPQGQF